MKRRRGRTAGMQVQRRIASAVAAAKESERNRTETPYPASQDVIARRVAEFLEATQDRSAAYQWPPIQNALAEGKPIELTHKGRRAFLLFRQGYRSKVDTRALEVEVARNVDLFFQGKKEAEKDIAKEGLTITEFARLFGVNRCGLSKHLVEIPSGPAPLLPVGKIPVRRIGNIRRIFPKDIFGAEGKEREHVSTHESSATVPADRSEWRRSVAHILDS